MNFNEELNKWLYDMNECTCGVDESDYCTCQKYSIDDYFAENNLPAPSKKEILVGYISYWKEGRPYLTIDNNTGYPLVGAGIEKELNALVVEVIGINNGFGAYYIDSYSVLKTK